MLLYLFDEPTWWVMAHVIPAVFIYIAVRKIRQVERSDERSCSVPVAYTIYATIGFFIGAYIDLLIYADSIGGIQGATPYHLAMIMSLPMVTLAVFLFLSIVDQRHRKRLGL